MTDWDSLDDGKYRDEAAVIADLLAAQAPAGAGDQDDLLVHLHCAAFSVLGRIPRPSTGLRMRNSTEPPYKSPSS